MGQSFHRESFEKFRQFIHGNFGILLNDSKEDTLKIKLSKLMERHDIKSYDEYYGILANNKQPQYLTEFINEITTNKTDFFRENNHFEYIKNNISLILNENARIAANREIRVWSAACSTGEEPYSIAMILKECLPLGINVKILATDISTKVLVKAEAGVYSIGWGDIEKQYLLKYFEKSDESFIINNSIRELVTFRLFNLMNNFPFRNTFDMVFCRNVMIYFDCETQQRIIEKIYNVLAPGGLMFIGYSESLINKKHHFKYIQPTVYKK